VEVQLFAVARQRAGTPVVVLELPEGATVAALKEALAAAYPALRPIVPSLGIALDGRYARDEEPIAGALEVVAIPPVSGGGSAEPQDVPGGSRWSS
jgi:molybdopterin converting factor small subunit